MKFLAIVAVKQPSKLFFTSRFLLTIFLFIIACRLISLLASLVLHANPAVPLSLPCRPPSHETFFANSTLRNCQHSSNPYQNKSGYCPQLRTPDVKRSSAQQTYSVTVKKERDKN